MSLYHICFGFGQKVRVKEGEKELLICKSGGGNAPPTRVVHGNRS
jgi:hypothetical protein